MIGSRTRRKVILYGCENNTLRSDKPERLAHYYRQYFVQDELHDNTTALEAEAENLTVELAVATTLGNIWYSIHVLAIVGLLLTGSVKMALPPV